MFVATATAFAHVVKVVFYALRAELGGESGALMVLLPPYSREREQAGRGNYCISFCASAARRVIQV